MKKQQLIALSLVAIMGMSVIAGCSSEGDTGKGTKINVVSSYGGDDGNRKNFEDAIAAYEKESGNEVKESSSNANEEWKASVHADFEVGSEPDVLFFFNGVDSNPIIEQDKVVSIDEIREEYPEYADNMKENMMGASPLDGENYSVPVNGFWEALFCNKTVLDKAGVTVPTEGYTWDQFLLDCEKIKNAGYTPIAVSFHEVPHYWFEYSTLNHGGMDSHLTPPASADDEVAQAWMEGLKDMKELHDLGYLPENALSAGDAETFQLMAEDKAAFAVDGSWKCGWFAENADPKNFFVALPPTKEARESTDIIGGISMGYYITRKAWEDESKRDACVKFVESMTTDEVVSKFSATGNVTALKDGAIPDPNADALVQTVYEMNKKVTGITGAVQDVISGEQKIDLFGNIKLVCGGTMTPEEAIESMLSK